MPRLTLCPERLTADPARVVIRPFHLAVAKEDRTEAQRNRAKRIIRQVQEMDARTCQAELALVLQDFKDRHWQTRKVFMERFHQTVGEMDGVELNLRPQQEELIGAYFCHEYSYAAAALMNPSIVPHPDQSGLTDGSVRFVMSLRAVGEGHISSIAFREGILTADGKLDLYPQPSFAVAANVPGDTPKPDATGAVLVERNEEASLSGTVLFPVTPIQRNGLEDLRLVRFEHEDGRSCFYGTYTAYDGSRIASEMLITEDFREFKLQPLTGSAARNKGMALFPRKVGGRYAMIGRQDGENIFYITSDDLLRWDEGELLGAPKYPWELVQMGNCGSPIEIDEGWLLLTHGVGAMRQYSIGAWLLDRDDPSKVLKRSYSPMLSPLDENREGYVPNVVYTCGAMVQGRRLFMPYGVADSSIGFAWYNLDDVLGEME